MDHGPVKPAYGYRIDYAGKTVVLSGDTRYSENLIAVYSHIVPSPAKEKDLERPTRKTYSGPLAVGYDLMSISIGEKITVEKRDVPVE